MVVFEAQTEKEDAKVRWQRDTKDITGNNKYTISAEDNKHLLTIGNVAPEDAGGYAVISGSSKVKFELKVKQAEGGSEGFWYLCSLLHPDHISVLFAPLCHFLIVPVLDFRHSHSTVVTSLSMHCLFV